MLACAVSGVLGFATTRAAAATYVVNSTEDRPDSDPFDGVCSAPVTGACTLRAAIMDANGTAGPDKIVVPSGTYQITRAAVDDGALVGDLDITESVTIEGAGSATTIVDGNGAVTNERVFHILPGATAVTISGLTVRNGKQGVAVEGEGGGIRCQAFGATLRDMVIAENSATEGGGVYVTGGGTLVLQNVTLQQNTATSHGGGISAKDCVLELRGVVLHDNSAVVRGGGLYASGVALTITDSTVDANDAFTGGGFDLRGLAASTVARTAIFSNTANGEGGGVYVAVGSPVTFTGCSIHHNTAAANGGGIYNTAPILIVRSLIDSNSAQSNGGGIMIPKLEPLTSRVEVLVENSTVSRNTAQFGAGIHYDQPQQPTQPHALLLRNSTIAHNTGSREGGGIYAKAFANISMQSTTIAANGLFRPSGGGLRGGGVLLADTARATAINTIVADNHTATAVTAPTPDDIYTAATTTFNLGSGHNFIESTTNCTFSGTTFGCILGQDPKFDAAGFAYNGGPTPTLALMANSPAINAANTAAATAGDQRGFMRNGVADMGAYEWNGGAPPVELRSAVSRKTHGSAGTFDIGLPLTGTPGVECRSGGVNGEHTIILNFANPLTSVGSAAVTSGNGVVAASQIGSDSRQYVVNLSGVTNGQRVIITLGDVTDSFGYTSTAVQLALDVLLGDTNGNGSVTASDIAQTKAQAGQLLSAANFRTDVNANGAINSTDISLVKSRSGTQLPRAQLPAASEMDTSSIDERGRL
jgi:CSLREA domain-containing protein